MGVIDVRLLSALGTLFLGVAALSPLIYQVLKSLKRGTPKNKGKVIKQKKRIRVWRFLPGIILLAISAGLFITRGLTQEQPPFTPVYVTHAFFPGGWMGDWGDITLDDAYTDNPRSGSTCIKITYSAAQSQQEGWAGIYWQYPDKNWGDNPDGRDLTGATQLTFWARGNEGGEKAEFKVGGITGKYPDSIQPPVSTGVIVLSDEWQRYTIDLTGKDLGHLIGGFCWVTSRTQNPHGCTIYLDDLRYE